MSIPIKYFHPYMLFNKNTLFQEILPHRDDVCAPKEHWHDLSCAPRAVHAQPGPDLTTLGRIGPQDFEMRFLTYKMLLSLFEII